MDKNARIESYFGRGGPFGEGIRILREIALQTLLEETLKWNAPIYTLDGKNVLGILAFKHHFGLWFYKGVFLSDFLWVLDNAKEGKTRAMRHWKFTDPDQIVPADVRAYMEEAISVERKGMQVPKARPKAVIIPEALEKALQSDPDLREQFRAMPPYKKRDFAEYITSAKQTATKERRLQKILPMIREGIGLNDSYR